MPFVKTVQRTLVDDKRQVIFHIADQSSGDNAGHLMAIVRLASNDLTGVGDQVPLIVTGPNQNSGLTALERSSLVDLLQKLYDTAKTTAGYVDTP